MPDRRQALKNISNSLQQSVSALQALTQPDDKDLPISITRLLDAIDRIDVAAAGTDHGPTA